MRRTRVRIYNLANEYSPEIAPHCMYCVVRRCRNSSADSIHPNSAVDGGAGTTFSAHTVDVAAAVCLGGVAGLGYLLGMEAPLTKLS